MNTFRYILSLLCAMLALSQTSLAQDTKAVPSDPVFPYLLTIQQPAEGATLDVMIKNASGTFTVVSSGQTVYNGTKVDLFFAPQEGYRLTEGSITYNGNATTAETLAPNDKGYTAQRSFKSSWYSSRLSSLNRFATNSIASLSLGRVTLRWHPSSSPAWHQLTGPSSAYFN